MYRSVIPFLTPKLKKNTPMSPNNDHRHCSSHSGIAATHLLSMRPACVTLELDLCSKMNLHMHTDNTAMTVRGRRTANCCHTTSKGCHVIHYATRHTLMRIQSVGYLNTPRCLDDYNGLYGCLFGHVSGRYTSKTYDISIQK